MSDKFENLERISRLLDAGRITPDEYQTLKTEVLNTPQGSNGPVEDSNRRPSGTSHKSGSGRLWLVAIPWAVGGFVVGVFVNGGLEAAAIGLSGDWMYNYRETWMWSLFPYTFAIFSVSVGLLIADRDHPRSRNQWLKVGAAFIAVLVPAAITLDAAGNRARGMFLASVQPLSVTETHWCEDHPDSVYGQIIEQWDLLSEAWEEAPASAEFRFHTAAGLPYSDENRDNILKYTEKYIPGMHAILCRSALFVDG